VKIKHKFLAIINFIVITTLIVWNYYSNTGAINNETVGSVSSDFNNLFTPASYAFAIWGLIYLGLLAMAGYLIYLAFEKHSDKSVIPRVVPTLTLANAGNAIWLWFWLNKNSGAALAIMFFVLLMLVLTVIRLKISVIEAPKTIKLLVWFPVSIYTGWISVASIANTAAHLNNSGWSPGISDVMCTVGIISVAALLAMYMIAYRKMYAFAAVVCWALIAIAARHASEVQLLMWTALSATLAIFLTALFHGVVRKKRSESATSSLNTSKSEVQTQKEH